MAAQRSFTEYVKKRFDNDFWAAAESFLEANLDSVLVKLFCNILFDKYLFITSFHWC